MGGPETEVAGRNPQRSKIDEDVASLLGELAAEQSRPGKLTAAVRREMSAAMFGLLRIGSVATPTVSVAEVVIELGARRIPLRLYRPQGHALDAPATVLYVHGGGWVAGSAEAYDVDVSRLANQLDLVVASVDYRLAPENPFPAALQDCLDAARWLASQSAPVALVGDSAGGNLALECALLLRGQIDLGPLLLLYPVVDPRGRRNHSYEINGTGYLLGRDDMDYYWASYLGAGATPEIVGDRDLSSRPLQGLPLTIVVSAGFDPLRDEDRKLVSRLVDEDVEVVYIPNPTLVHGFQQMVDRVPAARIAISSAYRRLKDAMAYVGQHD